MSFAEEVKASNADRNASSEVVAAALAKVSGDSSIPTLKSEATPVLSKPEIKEAIIESTADLDITKASFEPKKEEKKADVAVIVPPAKTEESSKAKIRIGGVEFDNVEDAVKYADTLALAKQQEDAYKEGYTKAKKEVEPPAPVEKAISEIIEEEFFKNPKIAIDKILEEAEKRIFEKYNKLTSDQAKAQAQAAAVEKVWDSFFEKNADLSEPSTRSLVRKHFMPEYLAKYGDLPIEKGMPLLAEMTREALKIKRQDALPTVELQSKPAIVPGASGEATNSATPEPKQEMLDFVSQVNKLRRRHAK